jgi:hypothetical protein
MKETWPEVEEAQIQAQQKMREGQTSSNRKWKYYAVVCDEQEQENSHLPFWIAREEQGHDHWLYNIYLLFFCRL